MTEELEPLKPLTPEEQAEFERRRETAAVVQFKCTPCGQWYEMDKRSLPFDEAFFCDCSAYVTFHVPAVADPVLASGIDYSDPDPRLDTGMRVSEATASASHWWGKLGRHLMKKERRAGKEVVSLDPEDPNYIPSGILNGEPWSELDRRERLTIVKHWHHWNIRKDQQL